MERARMKPLYEDILNAVAQARRAIRRGDVAAAERWLRVAQRTDEVVTVVARRLRSVEFVRRARGSN
jgi:hypothetical protein